MGARLSPGEVHLVVFDFDGVLTDNRVLVMEDGREAVMCSRSDGLGFDLLRAADTASLIMSTESNPVVTARARKLQVDVLQSVRDKGETILRHLASAAIDPKRVMFVGNDVNDLSAMCVVGYPVAVADAHPRVKELSWHVLRSVGGAGAAREVAEDLLGLRPSDDP